MSIQDLCGPDAPARIVELLEAERLPQAQAEIDQLARAKPRDAEIGNLQGVVFLLERRLSEAQAAFEQAAQLKPDSVGPRRNLGITFWHEHQVERARDALRAALDRNPNDALSNLYSGQIAFADHDCSRADGYFDRSRDALRTMPVAVFMDAVCRLELGDPQNATSLLQQIGPHAPIPPKSIFEFASQANRQHQYPLSLAAMKLLPPNYPDPYTRGFDEALAAYESSKGAEAAGLLRRLIAQGLATAESYDLLGNSLEAEGLAGKQPKLIEQAYDAYRRGIYLDPHYLANFIDISHLALTLGNYELCEQLLTQGLAQNPQSYELLIERGVAYALSSNDSKAAGDFEFARRLMPDNPVPYLTMSMLAIQEGRNGDAVKVLQKGIDCSHPPNAWLYFLLARSLYKQGLDTPEAQARIRSALLEAMRLDPTLTEAFALAGHVWLKSGNVEQALQYLETAHRLDPSNPHYVYVLANARRIQGNTRDAASDLRAFRELEAANNAARMREFFIKISATPASNPAFRDASNSK